jgi:hypothetical protein
MSKKKMRVNLINHIEARLTLETLADEETLKAIEESKKLF